MTKLTKEQLFEKLQHRIAVAAKYPDLEEAQLDAEIFKIALASLEAEPVGEFYHEKQGGWYQISEGDKVSDNRRIPLYAAPILPKQPELIGMKVSIDTGSDNIGHRLFGEIVGTSDSNGVPVLCIEVAENNGDMAAPAQPVIPEGLIKAINRLLDNDGSRGCFDALEQHRAKTELELLLAAEQQNEPQNIPENIATAHSAYISFDALMAAVSEVTGAKSEFDATPEKCYQAVPFMNFNSLSRIVEMFRTAQPVSEPYKSAAKDIIAERQRQISEEGWTPEHDDKYNDFQLALAAAGYAQNVADYAGEYCQPHSSINWTDAPEPEAWPWSPVWWKPTNPRRDLVKAGALILAEIERLDRAAPAQDDKPASTELPNHSNLSTNSPVIPDGWKLVPIEPTPKMLVAAMGMFTAEELAEAWGDMIEAAPAPAQEQK